MEISENLENLLRQKINRVISRFSPPGQACAEPEKKFRGHPHEEMLFVLKGESEYCFNGSFHHLAPGDAVLIDSWRPHAFGYTAQDRDLLHLWCWHFHRQWSALVFRVNAGGVLEHRTPAILLPQAVNMILDCRWQLFFDTTARKTPPPETLMIPPLALFFDEIALRLAAGKEAAPKLSEQLQNHIAQCNGRECSLETLARLTGYSRSYLAHAFRAETGITVGEFIDRVRREYVASAQRQGLRQKEIAHELGFATPVSFGNWLRKQKKRQ